MTLSEICAIILAGCTVLSLSVPSARTTTGSNAHVLNFEHLALCFIVVFMLVVFLFAQSYASAANRSGNIFCAISDDRLMHDTSFSLPADAGRETW